MRRRRRRESPPPPRRSARRGRVRAPRSASTCWCASSPRAAWRRSSSPSRWAPRASSATSSSSACCRTCREHPDFVGHVPRRGAAGGAAARTRTSCRSTTWASGRRLLLHLHGVPGGRGLRHGAAHGARQRREHVPLTVVLRVIVDAAHGLHFAHEFTDEHGASRSTSSTATSRPRTSSSPTRGR